MKNRIDSVGALLALLVSGSAACATETVPPTPVLLSAAPVLSYRYDGAQGTAQVTRELGTGGSETLTGTLALGTRAGRAVEVRSSERVALDGAGRLQHAEIAIQKDSSVEVFTLDPGRGSVRIERAGSASTEWTVPQDAPWVYTPAALGDGSPSMTPVSSWVALRAARSATVVRVLDPVHQTSYLAPIDQVAVPTELGTTVSFGHDAVDADERFITELRLSGGALILSRAGSS